MSGITIAKATERAGQKPRETAAFRYRQIEVLVHLIILTAEYLPVVGEEPKGEMDLAWMKDMQEALTHTKDLWSTPWMVQRCSTAAQER